MPRERGARRERVFFGEDDYALYRDLLASQCRKHGVAVFCLLPDAQPRSSHSRPRPRGGARSRARRGAAALFVGNKRAAQGDRPSCCELSGLAHRVPPAVGTLAQKTAGICLNQFANDRSWRFPTFHGANLKVGKGEGFRAPALLRTVLQAPGPALESLPRRKPRGGWGLFFERAYGDLRNADGWRARRRRPAALGVFSGRDDGGCFRWRRWAGARRSHRSKEDWRPPADIALLFRRAAGGGGDRRCEAGWMATVMRCRS